MLTSLLLAARGSLAASWPEIELAALTSPRSEPPARAEPAPFASARELAARDVVRLAAPFAVLIALALAATDVWTLAFENEERWRRMTPIEVSALVLCTALVFILHVRHVLYVAVRGRRPPAAMWTLAALAVVSAIGVEVGGPVWTRELAPLAVSLLLLVPARWALPGVAILLVTPLVVVDARWYAIDDRLPGVYFALAIAWRTVTQYVPLCLLSVLRALDAATHELEVRACISARSRIESEVRGRLGPTLRQIVTLGEASRAAIEAAPDRALAELRRLVGESRRGLADARRVAASYRRSSLRADLDAAIALLEASGARVELVVDAGVSLDAAEHAPAARSLRAAVEAALRHDRGTSYRIHVSRDASGPLLRVTSDAPAQEPS